MRAGRNGLVVLGKEEGGGRREEGGGNRKSMPYQSD